MEEDKEIALAQMRQAVQDLESSTDGYGDATLMRFLIARSMVPEKAAKMFVQWQEWRASFVTSGSISEDEVRDQLNDRKVFLGDLTKEGYPLIIVKGSRHYPTKDRLQFRKFAVHALDKAIASLTTRHLAKCYMLNMSRFLASMWKMISYFLDKATQEKIIFVYSEEEKREFIKHVGEDIVPEEYGGKPKLVAIQDVDI